MEVKDLNVASDIFSLFNYTLNDDARAAVRRMVITPLPSKEAALARQDILKGFIANIEIFGSYSYSKIDFREVNLFLDTFSAKAYLLKRLKYRLLFSGSRFANYRSRLIQLVLLYHRLHSHYIRKLVTSHYPEAYKQDIRLIDSYLNGLRLDYFVALIHDNGLRVKHLIEFMKLIAERQAKGETAAFREAFTMFEAYLSVSRGIHTHGLVFPDITDGGFSLTDFYHPLLKKPVKNSFTATGNVVLLTGPNMSGKSTLLRAIGICAYLGNIGFGIPAASGRLPFYDNISVFINLNDDLQSGYSHFMTEVMNLKHVVVDARERKCFAVFDELFRGTNIDDALEISRITLRGMLNFPDSLFFVSSHLHQLAAMEEVQNGRISCHYLDCDLEENVPSFTYRLRPGWSDIKIGRILFEKEKLNELLS